MCHEAYDTIPFRYRSLEPLVRFNDGASRLEVVLEARIMPLVLAGKESGKIADIEVRVEIHIKTVSPKVFRPLFWRWHPVVGKKHLDHHRHGILHKAFCWGPTELRGITELR